MVKLSQGRDFSHTGNYVRTYCLDVFQVRLFWQICVFQAAACRDFSSTAEQILNFCSMFGKMLMFPLLKLSIT